MKLRGRKRSFFITTATCEIGTIQYTGTCPMDNPAGTNEILQTPMTAKGGFSQPTAKLLTSRQRSVVLWGVGTYAAMWLLVSTGVFEYIKAIDIPLHFFGGLLVALFFRDYLNSEKIRSRGQRYFLAALLASVLVIGALWELHEYILTLYLEKYFAARAIYCCMGDAFDTIKDLLMDTLGGATAGFWILHRERNKKID